MVLLRERHPLRESLSSRDSLAALEFILLQSHIEPATCAVGAADARLPGESAQENVCLYFRCLACLPSLSRQFPYFSMTNLRRPVGLRCGTGRLAVR